MFRRIKREGDEPVANQLLITNEPNVLKSGRASRDERNELEWTAAGITADIEPENDEFEAEDELDDEGSDEDGRSQEERRAALEAELQRQAEEFGLTGDNPIGLYGPNGEEIAALLDSLGDIDDETA
jgi:hypothetical protein